jgi:hypothetical protein
MKRVLSREFDRFELDFRYPRLYAAVATVADSRLRKYRLAFVLAHVVLSSLDPVEPLQLGTVLSINLSINLSIRALEYARPGKFCRFVKYKRYATPRLCPYNRDLFFSCGLFRRSSAAASILNRFIFTGQHNAR